MIAKISFLVSYCVFLNIYNTLTIIYLYNIYKLTIPIVHLLCKWLNHYYLVPVIISLNTISCIEL